ncbi:MAG: RHS repeat-associated core domain-containing protein [Gammaproteobacteria bacterium]
MAGPPRPLRADHRDDPDGRAPPALPGSVLRCGDGLHYNYVRDYDPAVGRYIESDPIRLAGGINTYSYVANNPLRFTDPTGQAIPAVIAGCAANPACVALAGATAVALGNAISGTLSALSGDDNNIIPFPKPTSHADEQCSPDDGKPDECELWRNNLILESIRIQNNMTKTPMNDLTKRRWNLEADKYNKECVPKGFPPITFRFGVVSRCSV